MKRIKYYSVKYGKWYDRKFTAATFREIFRGATETDNEFEHVTICGK